MTLRPANGRPEHAMAEEFENYEARMAEAHRAVERWEAEGGARESEIQAEEAAGAPPRGHDGDIPPGESGPGRYDRGGSGGRRDDE